MRRQPDDDLAAQIVAAAASGRRLRRPAARPPFATGPSCTVLRVVPTGGMVVAGPEGLVEAGVSGPGIAARPPLVVDAAGEELLRLEHHGALDGVVAVDGNGAPLATFLRAGSVLDRVLDVRDETSAPVARFAPAPGGAGFVLLEVGGGVLATGAQRSVERDGWIDDEWSVTAGTAPLPLQPLALVALALAAKVCFGLPEPVAAHREGVPATGAAGAR